MELETFITSGLKVLGVLVLVALNGFFVAAEFAFVKLRDTQLAPLVARGQRRARIALRIVHNIEACISATQLGITFCGMATGAVVKPVFQALLRPVFQVMQVESKVVRDTSELIVGFLVSTILLIVLGELVPKALAIRRTLPTALAVSQPLLWFYRLTFPLIWVLNHTAQWFLGLFDIHPLSESQMQHSDEEVRLLVKTAQEQAGATALGRDIVLNALDLRRRIAREVMRPRPEIVGLSTDASIAECLQIAEKTRYSRFPLCEGGNLDQTLGVVHIKDLYAMRIKAHRGADLLPAVRRIIYVPETAKLELLLQRFLERQLHLAIVVDEYGGTVGMVTLENILEELVGQIQDEFDQERPWLVKVGDQAWEIDGALPLHELAELTGEPVGDEGITTTSGLVTHRLGGFPKPGDVLALGGFRLKVEEMDGLRVARLRLTRAAAGPPAG